MWVTVLHIINLKHVALLKIAFYNFDFNSQRSGYCELVILTDQTTD